MTRMTTMTAEQLADRTRRATPAGAVTLGRCGQRCVVIRLLGDLGDEF
jgi:hypothetical protein